MSRLTAVALAGATAAAMSSRCPRAVAGARAAARPERDAGEAVTAAFEGWFTNRTAASAPGRLLQSQPEADARHPGRPEQRIEPGGPDHGQPTHFLPRRQWGVFTIPVPKDFGDKKLTWTIVANGQTTSIPLEPAQAVSGGALRGSGDGQHAADAAVRAGGAVHTGPPIGTAATLAATVGEPLALPAWVTDKPAKIIVNVARPPGAGGRGRPPPAGPRPGVELHRGPARCRLQQGEARHRQGRRGKDDDHRDIQRSR